VRDGFALASFLARWSSSARHDLSASESATLRLADLLAMAEADDQRRWEKLSLGYGDPNGAPWLRAEIATRHHGLEADDLLCCAGAHEGLTCVMRALLAPGDHVVVVVPIYQPSEQAVTSICAATGVPLQDCGGWRLDIDRVAAAVRPQTRLVLMNFPNSPTGAPIDRTTLESLVELCRRHGLWRVNDEVYRTMAEDAPASPPPVADIYERGISINAVSKGFGLPGLRVGWVVCRDRGVLARVLRAKSGLSSCLGTPNEVLAHIALRAEVGIVARNKAIARSNSKLMQSVFARHPDLFACDAPGNLAFAAPRYLGARDAGAFAVSLVRAAGVLLLPFGLWRTMLAEVPADRLRIGLGGSGVARALATLDEHLVNACGRATVA
jgi:hypothetical protein